MPTPYTGPGGPSRRDWFVWYHRMVDVCSAVYQWKHALICNPQDEDMLKDMLEKLIEDEAWHHDGRPDLYTLPSIRQGDLYSFDPTKGQVKTFSEMMNGASTGFARWKGLYLPTRDGITDPFDVYTDKPH